MLAAPCGQFLVRSPPFLDIPGEEYEYTYSCIFMRCRNCHAISRFGDLVANQKVASQEELRRLLFKRGHRVTQATLSRDVHELRLVKTSEGYKLPQGEVANLSSVDRAVDSRVRV